MSTHITDEIVAVQVGEEYGRPFLIVAELGGDNNVRERDTGRRARDWCATAVGVDWGIIGEAAHIAASCAGGMLRLAKRSNTTPEAYIRAYRRALARALTVEEARAAGMTIKLRLRLFDTDEDKYARERLDKAGHPSSRTDYYKAPATVYEFALADPAQVALWQEHACGRKWHAAEIDGPDRSWPLDQLRRALRRKDNTKAESAA